MSVTIALASPGDGERTAAHIMAALPVWFGRPEATARYLRLSSENPTLLAQNMTEDVGFLTLLDHFGLHSEIAVMAVHPDHHREGIGTRLVEAAMRIARKERKAYLSVKTLAATDPDPGYAATRAFYLAMGFQPFETLDGLWGADTPCLQMIRPLP